jgi:flagellar motility protein MotE (MotC chaperone)
MSKWLRDMRVLPIVLIAIVCLFVLKTMGLLFDGGYTLGQRLGGTDTLVVTTVPVASPTVQLRSPSQPLEVASSKQDRQKSSWMQEMFNYPGGHPDNSSDITGSAAAKPAEKKETAKREPPVPVAPESIAARGTPVQMDQPRTSSPGERALLERLQERRQELEARARELDLRESLVKAAEKKLETPASDAPQGEVGGKVQRKDDKDKPRLKSVVTMYETMKPKDAAKIFDRLDPKVLLEVASHMKPQQMAAILAQMSPESAERLTVELATDGPADRSVNPANLPKIDGRPAN